MASEKTQVIDYLWDLLQQEGTGRTVVTATDVVSAIEHCSVQFNIGLSTRNPANFMKDVVRGDNASDFWPVRLTQLGITARQRPGDQRIFEFVTFAPGQTEPFPNTYTARPGMPVTPIGAASLSLAKRRLGRTDESWLIQVAVELRLVENHFATRSSLPIEEISHLQTGVKLGTSEIDTLYLAQLRASNGQYEPALVTGEAKQEGQRNRRSNGERGRRYRKTDRGPFGAFGNPRKFTAYKTLVLLVGNVGEHVGATQSNLSEYSAFPISPAIPGYRLGWGRHP